MLNYEPLVRWAFLESSLVDPTTKSNFSMERCKVLSKLLLDVLLLTGKPFCWFQLIALFCFGFFPLHKGMILP